MNSLRRSLAATVAVLLTATLVAFGAAPAGAAPQDISLVIVDGLIEIGDDLELEFPEGTGVTGTWDDETGDLDVELVVPVLEVEYELTPGTAIPLIITITQEGDGLGFIDPDTGDTDLDITIHVGVGAPPGGLVIPDGCSVGPIDLALSSDPPGEPFDFDAGTVTLATDGFAVPAATGCGGLDAIVNDGLGLPRADTAAVVVLETGDIQIPPPTTAPPTTAPPVTEPPPAEPPPAEAAPAGRHLPGGSITPLYTCRGADEATQTILDLLGDEPLSFSPVVSMAPVSPSPNQGEQFTASFTASLSLAPDLVSAVMAVGITEATVSNLVITISPGDGVAGENFVVRPPARTFTLVAGQPLSFTIGPESSAFTRTSAIGEVVAFAVEPLTVTLGANLGGAPIELHLACDPSGETVLSMVDAEGATAPAGGILPVTGADRDLIARLLAAAAGTLVLGAALLVLQRRRMRPAGLHSSAPLP